MKSEKGMLLLVLALSILVWVPRLRGPIDLRWDGSVYYILGTSLADGKGYKLLNEPGEIDATQYPPLLPAIIAAHQLALGTNDFVVVGRSLRLSFFLVFLAYILAAYWLIRGSLPLKYAVLATLVCLFNNFTYFMSDLCFADILFGLTTTLFFVCNGRSGRRAYPVLAVLLAMASYLLRTAGAALLIAWIADSLIKKQFRQGILRTACVVLVMFGWQAYVSSVESSHLYKNPVYPYQRAEYLFYNVTYARNVFSFVDPLSPERGPASLISMSKRFVRNVLRMPASLGEGVSTNRGYWEKTWRSLIGGLPPRSLTGWVVSGVLFILGCLVLGGIGLQLADGRSRIVALYVLLYLALMCLTPWPGQFPRYLAPLAPMLALSLFGCLVAIQRQSQGSLAPPRRIAGSALVVCVVAVILIQEFVTFYQIHTEDHQQVVYSDRGGNKVAYRQFFYKDSYRALDEGLDWLKRRAQPDDVVAASSPHWVYLRTGLKAVMPPFELDPVTAQHLLDTVPVSYLILEEGALDIKRYTLPVTQKVPKDWALVYSAPEGNCSIYQRVNRQ
jgi:4-amino-4-deoxy-L-arabinose transferase-like glycosyltransferase